MAHPHVDHPTAACAQLGQLDRAHVQRCLCVLVWISITCISFCFPLLSPLPWSQVEAQQICCSLVLSQLADIPRCCRLLQSLQKLPPPKMVQECQEGRRRMRKGKQLQEGIGNMRGTKGNWWREGRSLRAGSQMLWRSSNHPARG